MTKRPGHRALLSLAALGVAALVGLTACGGGDDSQAGIASAGGAAVAPSASATADGLQFAACMRQNGIDMPDPDPATSGGGLQSLRGKNIDATKLDKALQACQQYQPAGGPGSATDPQNQQQLQALAKCMREHGVDMPDPDPTNGFQGMIGQLQTLQSDPDWSSALTACQSLRPTGGAK